MVVQVYLYINNSILDSYKGITENGLSLVHRLKSSKNMAAKIPPSCSYFLLTPMLAHSYPITRITTKFLWNKAKPSERGSQYYYQSKVPEDF